MRFRYLLIVLLMVVLCTIPVGAASAFDDCTSLQDSVGRSCQNLIDGSGVFLGNDFPQLPDRTCVAISNLRQPGMITYSGMEEIDTVQISLYSSRGTFATLDGERPVLGSVSEIVNNPQRLYLDPQSGLVYLKTTGGAFSLYYEDFAYHFQNAELPAANLIPLGLNLSVSRDGKSFTPVSPAQLTVRKYTADSGELLYYEDYQFLVPKGSKYIRVSIQDFWQIPRADGSMVYESAPKLFLARVWATGVESPAPLPDDPEEEPDKDEDKGQDDDKDGESEKSDSKKESGSSNKTASGGGSGGSTTTHNTSSNTTSSSEESTTTNTTTTNNTTNNYFYGTVGSSDEDAVEEPSGEEEPPPDETIVASLSEAENPDGAVESEEAEPPPAQEPWAQADMEIILIGLFFLALAGCVVKFRGRFKK